MFGRPVLFVGVLAAAIGVPYVLLDKNVAQTAGGQWSRLVGKSTAAKADSPANHAAGSNIRPVAMSAAAVSIEEAFRFEIQPAWVIGRFPTVSTVAGGVDELGMRVALVTGTRPDDIAGSMSYYFDAHHQLQRITFTGQTADPRRLLATIVPRHGLKSLPTTDAAHYVGGDPKKPTSEVTVKYLPMVQSQAGTARTEVKVDLRRSDVVDWEKKQLDRGEPSLLPPSYRQW